MLQTKIFELLNNRMLDMECSEWMDAPTTARYVLDHQNKVIYLKYVRFPGNIFVFGDSCLVSHSTATYSVGLDPVCAGLVTILDGKAVVSGQSLILGIGPSWIDGHDIGLLLDISVS